MSVENTYLLLRKLDDGHGTFGRLYNPAGDELCRIVEKPWRNNIKKDSCIPVGKYKLGFYPYGKKFYPRYRKEFAKQGNEKGMIHILDIPGRSHVLWHKGNYPENSWGCLLTNMSVGRNEQGELQGYRSADAYRRVYPIVREAMEKADTYLEIVSGF